MFKSKKIKKYVPISKTFKILKYSKFKMFIKPEIIKEKPAGKNVYLY
jgi:hypothetical protein